MTEQQYQRALEALRGRDPDDDIRAMVREGFEAFHDRLEVLEAQIGELFSLVRRAPVTDQQQSEEGTKP